MPALGGGCRRTCSLTHRVPPDHRSVGSKIKLKSRPSHSNASSFRDWYPQTVPRPSPVRDAIRQCLTAQPRHGWSLDELLGQLHRVDVSADFSTVFRALNWLEGEGEVRRVDLGDGKARYEANTVVVASGLAKGDIVVTAGVNTLRVGQEVRLADATPVGSNSK